MATFFDRCFSIVVAASYIHLNEKSPQRKQIKSHSLNSAVRELLYLFKLKCTKKHCCKIVKEKNVPLRKRLSKANFFQITFQVTNQSTPMKHAWITTLILNTHRWSLWSQKGTTPGLARFQADTHSPHQPLVEVACLPWLAVSSTVTKLSCMLAAQPAMISLSSRCAHATLRTMWGHNGPAMGSGPLRTGQDRSLSYPHHFMGQLQIMCAYHIPNARAFYQLQPLVIPASLKMQWILTNSTSHPVDHVYKRLLETQPLLEGNLE